MTMALFIITARAGEDQVQGSGPSEGGLQAVDDECTPTDVLDPTDARVLSTLSDTDAPPSDTERRGR